MKRVVLTSMYGGLGGGEVALLQHARSLRLIGVEVRVVLMEEGPFVRQLEADGFRVDIIDFFFGANRVASLARLLGSMMRVRRLLISDQPDLVVSYTFNDFVVFSIPCLVARIPVILRSQGEYFRRNARTPDVWLGGLFIPLIRFLRAHVIPTTRYEEGSFVRSGISGEFCSHIPLGVPAPLKLSSKREGNHVPVISIFGRLVRWKGQDVFLNAMVLLKARGCRFKARVVGGADFGDGDQFLKELTEIVRAADMSADVEFLGHRSDIQALMADSDIVCHCSRFEPFGLVVVEAMRAGCAVVASDVDGPRESVRDGETGYLVEPGSPEKLAERVAMLLCDPGLRHELGTRASLHAAENFDLDLNLGRLNDACLSIANS